MRLASFAWTALAQNRNDEALGLMRQAADLEDKSEKHIVTRRGWCRRASCWATCCSSRSARRRR